MKIPQTIRCLAIAGTFLFTMASAFGAVSFNPTTTTTTTTTVTLGEEAALDTDFEAVDGSKLTLTVGATGASALSYQWFKDLDGIVGAEDVLVGKTAKTLVLTGLKQSDEATYYVRISEAGGGTTAFSAKVNLTINFRPKFTATGHPMPLTVSEDVEASFTVALDPISTPPFTYRWQRNNVDIPGGTFTNINALTHTFTIAAPPGAQWQDAGNYRCIVSNPGKTTTSVASKAAALKVTSSPVILVHPAETLPNTTLIIAAGGTGVLKVGAGGNPPLKYQWFKDGVAIPNATGATLSVKGVDGNLTPGVASGPGSYKVQVTNDFTISLNGGAPAESNAATVVVINKLVFTKTPPPVQALPAMAKNLYAAGDAVTLQVNTNSVNVGAPTYPTYQWYKDGKIIAGATAAQLIFNAIQWSDRGAYKCVVINQVSKITSPVLAIGVTSPPIILSQTMGSGLLALTDCTTTTGSPNVGCASTAGLAAGMVLSGPGVPAGGTLTRVASVTDGTNFVMTANATITAGVESLTDGATTDGSPIVTCASTANLIVGMTVTGSGIPAGATVASITDAQTLVLSSNATATATMLTFAASLTWQAEGPLKGPTGGSATLAVVAGGTSPFTYQWFKVVNNANNPVTGAKAAKLTLTKLAEANEGLYFCAVTNAFGTTNSTAVYIVVDDLPTIGTQPVATSRTVGQSGNVLNLVAAGDAPLRYQWQLGSKNLIDGLQANGSTVAGAMTASLSIDNIQVTNAGSYRCIVTNDVGKVTSKVVKVTVLTSASIVTHPIDKTVIEELSTTLNVVAAGSPPLSYQWLRFQELSPGNFVWVPLSGKTTATLTFASVQTTDEGMYLCRVNNSAGVPVDSNPAMLTVSPIPPANISDFFPQTAKAGEKVRVLGTNMNYVKEINIGAIPASFVIESPTALLFTVPGTAPTVATPFSLVTKHDVTDSTTGFAKSATYFNDEIVNSTVLTGTAVNVAGSNEGHTNSGDGFFLGAISTTWYWWRAPEVGTYIILVDGAFDASLVAYRGSPVNPFSRTFVDASGFDCYPREAVSVTVGAANQDYLFMIEGNTCGAYPTYGNFALSITRISGSTVGATGFDASEGFSVGQSLDGQQAWNDPSEGGLATQVIVTEGDDDQQAVRLGGDQASGEESVVLFKDANDLPQGTPEVTTAFTMNLEAPADGVSSDMFGWTLYDSAANPMAGLWLNAADGGLYATAADGTQEWLDQKVLAGAPHHFEVHVDQAAGTWSASIDGVMMVTDSPLPEGAVFKEVCPVWLPSKDGSPHAAILFDDITVFAAEAE